MNSTKTAPIRGCATCPNLPNAFAGCCKAPAVRDCNAGHVLFANRCDMPAGHTGYHTDGYISWVGRERWRFAGRDWTADGIPFYVWRLYNLDKSVNSVWVAPVSDLLRPAVPS